MQVRELMRYTQAFYPRWDETYAEELREMFDLDPKARIRNLSRGQRARAGLLVAIAHRPDLLVLDEPSSGLDPIVRRDILAAVIKTITGDGRTFCSRRICSMKSNVSPMKSRSLREDESKYAVIWKRSKNSIGD